MECQAFWDSHACDLVTDHPGDHVCLLDIDHVMELSEVDSAALIVFYEICDTRVPDSPDVRWDTPRRGPRPDPPLLLAEPDLYFEVADRSVGCVSWAGTCSEAFRRLQARVGPEETSKRFATLERYGIPLPYMAGCARRWLARAAAEA